MAHELDRLADGTGAMFSVRDTPWHREGTLLTEAPSLERALELGGLCGRGSSPVHPGAALP
jgi:hypothetical protein